jgi:hypothetical protein
MTKLFRTVAVATVLLVVGANAAQAAAVRSGATLQAIVALTRGTAVAYDSTNKVYLVVGSHGVLWGRFVRADGAPVGTPFAIQGNPANFAHFPRAAFSPDADNGTGGFLVTWHEGGPNVHGRMVSVAKNGAFGPDTQLTGDVSWWEAGAAVAYSTVSHEFLVAWRSLPFAGGPATNDIHAVRVDNAAGLKGPVFAITADIQYQDNPSVAYDPVTDEFMVVFAGFDDAGNFAFVDSQRVKAGTNTLLGGPVRLTVTGGTYITDVSYNSAANTYLASWYSLPGGAAFGRVINANGTLNGGIITLSTRWKAYDALSVAYNRRSDTYFMVSHGSTAEDGGVEIASGGTPVDNGFIVTAAGGNGNFYPRIGASADDPNWLVSTANNFSSTMVQLVAGTASGAAPPPPGPVTPVPNPLFNVDTPSNGATVLSNGFLISGWAVDLGATSGTGIDVVVCWAYPKTGAAPILAGVASYGHPRPDVGAWLGARFTPSGWGFLGVLPPGGYTLAVYAHSTVNNSWGTPRLLDTTVTAPPSDPRMHVDLPSQNQDVTQNNVLVAGWAIDRAAAAGSGVDTVHIWAFPALGGAPTLLGGAAAQMGDPRPDVATAFGSSKYANAGFHIVGSLPPGKYTIVVYAHSAVTKTFNNTSVVTVTVR